MEKITKNNLIYFKFPHIDLLHCFTTKHGGASTGVAASMNVDKSKEPRENVHKNFTILGQALGFEPASLIGLSQTHTARVEIVNDSHMGNKIHKSDIFGGCDGMVTNDPELTLLTMHADCLALYFYDPIHQIIGLSHAGWRGTVGSIAGETIKKMGELGSKPENILAGISPGIGFCCFQVDYPVVIEFENNFIWADEYIVTDNELYHDQARGTGYRKYKIDLVGVNKRVMLEHGILDKNIHAQEICTKCNHDLFHSHRVTGKDRGNMGAILSLKK